MITGISAISGEQLIAAGAISAKEAATAAFTTGGNDIQDLYDTVSTNSGSWTGGGGGATFPAEIKTGDTLVGVVTTGFQDNTATRPTLFISGTTATNNYPRMLLSENHAAAQTSKSGAFLADAFEFYTGKNGTSTKILRIDTANVSGTYFWLNKNEVHGATGNTAYYLAGFGASGKAAADKGWSITISGISGQSANGASDTWKVGAEEYVKWNSAYDQLGNVTALLNSI